MDQVQNITHIVNLPHDILVSWDAVVGATSYTAELRSGNQTIETKTVAVPEVPFTALIIGQIYEIQITATDGVGTSQFTRYVVYLSERDWLSPPPDLAYTELETRDGFNITWGASPSALTYRMVVEQYGAQDPVELFNGPVTSPHVISGLQPEMLYRIYVYPVNGSEEGQPATIVAWVQPEVGDPNPTAHKLFPAEVQGSYYLLYRPYIENMRPLREDDRYWRLKDTVSWSNVKSLRAGMSKFALDLWRAEITGDLSNQILLVNESASTDETQVTDDRYFVDHTKEILSVSLEFDQLQRPLMVFQDVDSDIWLYWYDPQLSAQTSTLMGKGITPHICTTNYYRFGNTTNSERFLFYIEQDTRNVVGFRQNDRYSTKLTISSSEYCMELLECSKTYYGGLAVIGCIKTATGDVIQKTWTSLWNGSPRALGTDQDLLERNTFACNATITQPLIYEAANKNSVNESALVASVTIGTLSMSIYEKVIKVVEGGTTGASVPKDSGIAAISLDPNTPFTMNIRDVQIRAPGQSEKKQTYNTQVTVPTGSIWEAKIGHTAKENALQSSITISTPLSGTIG